jgi:anaerobic magnesium-protoporphyrin IX monomethyl ester cyclase
MRDCSRQTFMPHQGRNQVVLYTPHFVPEAGRRGAYYRSVPPVSLLALAGPVRDAGYDVHLLDARWDLDWKPELRERVDQLACVGITSLTGPSVADGLQFASYVRELRPDLPIVWGGWHATFAARQAAADPRVDVVVRGFGERTFVELLAAFRSGQSLRDIRGISFREGQEIIETPERPVEDINQFPPPAYDLIDPKRYIHNMRPGIRQTGVVFSRGCPFECDFCLDSRSKWLGLTVERMLAEMEYWVGLGVNQIVFLDGNFFLGKQRIVEFCEAILARGLEKKVRWSGTAVGNRVMQMDDGLLALLARAGLRSVAMGAESGSQELLDRITNKTTVEHNIEAIRRLTRHGISQYLSLMVGYPGEPADALELTLRFAHQAKRINPDAEIQVNFTTPLPGSEVFRYAVERGLVEEPRDFGDWARFDYLQPNVLHLAPAYARRVRRFVRQLRIAFPGLHVAAGGGSNEWAKRPIRRVVRWHLGRKYSASPLDGLVAGSTVPAANAPRLVLPTTKPGP